MSVYRRARVRRVGIIGAKKEIWQLVCTFRCEITREKSVEVCVVQVQGSRFDADVTDHMSRGGGESGVGGSGVPRQHRFPLMAH